MLLFDWCIQNFVHCFVRGIFLEDPNNPSVALKRWVIWFWFYFRRGPKNTIRLRADLTHAQLLTEMLLAWNKRKRTLGPLRYRQTKKKTNLLRDKLWVWWKRATKLKFVAQSRSVLYFSQQLSSTRNKCFCCGSSWSRKVKTGNIDENLQRNNVALQVEGFCISYFAAFKQLWK